MNSSSWAAVNRHLYVHRYSAQWKRHAGDKVLNKTALPKTRHSLKERKMSLNAARLLALLCMRSKEDVARGTGTLFKCLRRQTIIGSEERKSFQRTSKAIQTLNDKGTEALKGMLEFLHCLLFEIEFSPKWFKFFPFIQNRKVISILLSFPGFSGHWASLKFWDVICSKQTLITHSAAVHWCCLLERLGMREGFGCTYSGVWESWSWNSLLFCIFIASIPMNSRHWQDFTVLGAVLFSNTI